jgi:hypothetical protein
LLRDRHSRIQLKQGADRELREREREREREMGRAVPWNQISSFDCSSLDSAIAHFAVGFEDIDVQQLARESARMRTDFELALRKELEKVHSLQQQLMSLQDQADNLHDMLIQQKSEYEEKLEAAKPPPSKSKNIQTDPWEPPQRGVSPTTVASTVEAARLEVRAKWEGRLKDCEARLAEAKAMVRRPLSLSSTI